MALSREAESLLYGALSWDEVFRLQKDPRANGIHKDYDPAFASRVDELARALKDQENIPVSIPRAESEALNVRDDDNLTVKYLRKKMADPRYWDSNRRDPDFCEAIARGFRELAEAGTGE